MRLEQKLVITIVLSMQHVALCQDLKCDSAYAYFDRLNSNTIGLMQYAAPPVLIESDDILHLSPKDSLNSGIIFIRFIINKQGKPQCARIVKRSNSAELNDRAVNLISQLNFKPAEQRGEPIVSVWVLPVTYGDQRTTKRRGKKN